MNETNDVTRYINYFRGMAVSHNLMRHNVAGENGDCEPGAVRFTKISVDQVLKALKSKIGFPCLTLELFTIETNSEIVYNVRQRPRGAFMVIDHPADESFAAEEACYTTSLEIVFDILRKIWADHYVPGVNRCATPFKDFEFSKLEITPVGPIFNKEYGYRVEFDFDFSNVINLASPPADGVFI